MKSQYFNNRIEEAHQEVLGAHGSEVGDEYMEMFGDDQDDIQYNNFQGQEMLNASGQGVMGYKHDSQPYIIKIQNTTTADVDNVKILDASAEIGAGGFTNPAGISITYGLPNITYAQFLANINNGLVINAGQSRLSATHPSSTAIIELQPQTVWTVETKNINANAVQKTFVPQYDSYQQIRGQIDIYYNYIIDALTSITFATIYAQATLTFYIYPAVRNNQMKQMAKGVDTTQYKNPKINPFLKKV